MAKSMIKAAFITDIEDVWKTVTSLKGTNRIHWRRSKEEEPLYIIRFSTFRRYCYQKN